VLTETGQLSEPGRRTVLRAGLIAGAGLAAAPVVAGCGAGTPARPASDPAPEPPALGDAFSGGWLFGGEYQPGAEAADYDDRRFTPVTLPHSVAELSWGGWDPGRWEKVWIYRRHFTNPLAGPGRAGWRAFAEFDAVMVSAVAVLNGRTIGSHQGGYLPWSVELTRHLAPGPNVLAVIVDARSLPVPPIAPGQGPDSIDFLQPGGIYREAALRVVPPAYLADLFARPTDVLTTAPAVDVQCTVDAAAPAAGPAGGQMATVTAELLDGDRVLARTAQPVRLGAGRTVTRLRLDRFGAVQLWSPDHPHLYTARATVAVPGQATHRSERRIGFRETTFAVDGFYLNGERTVIFGLNRHQLFPYLGLAAPARLQRRDAELLRTELNCTMVRCSCYPQSRHFLDACDELGLMVWEETPGWGWLGGAAWQELVLSNVHDMVVRDRSRPSVIIWATRLNETPDSPGLNRRARRLAHQLDGSRPTTGAMRVHSTAGWAEDVFSYDDYNHARPGSANLDPPLPGVPYLVSEAVGALDGVPTFRWNDPGTVLASQALMHAEAHDTVARPGARYAGLLGWVGIDYASMHHDGPRIWDRLKTPGVLDSFRVAKPGAAIYQAQVDPAVRPVLRPVFSWDFGPLSPPHGPGPDAMIATNCDRLEVYLAGRHLATGVPDTRRFGALAHPPVFVDLTVDRADRPELRIDGYLGGRLVARTRMSADPARDRLAVTAAHGSIVADGRDMTQVTFRAVDVYGNRRPYATGTVALTLDGPADLIGDQPFAFGEYGGVGGAFVRSRPGVAGTVRVSASHPALGRGSVTIRVTDPPSINKSV
jgi:beta-galactosidase